MYVGLNAFSVFVMPCSLARAGGRRVTDMLEVQVGTQPNAQSMNAEDFGTGGK